MLYFPGKQGLEISFNAQPCKKTARGFSQAQSMTRLEMVCRSCDDGNVLAGVPTRHRLGSPRVPAPDLTDLGTPEGRQTCTAPLYALSTNSFMLPKPWLAGERGFQNRICFLAVEVTPSSALARAGSVHLEEMLESQRGNRIPMTHVALSALPN